MQALNTIRTHPRTGVEVVAEVAIVAVAVVVGMATAMAVVVATTTGEKAVVRAMKAAEIAVADPEVRHKHGTR